MGAPLNLVYHKVHILNAFFILISYLFIYFIEIDLANHAFETFLHEYNLKNNILVKLLGKILIGFALWMCILLANCGKTLLHYRFKLKLDKNSSWNLLCIIFHNKFNFVKHFTPLYRKFLKNIKALVITAFLKKMTRHNVVMDELVFIYYPLLWMIYNVKASNRIVFIDVTRRLSSKITKQL